MQQIHNIDDSYINIWKRIWNNDDRWTRRNRSRLWRRFFEDI